MKRWYFVVALAFALGFGFVMFAVSSTNPVTLLTVTIQPHVIKGLGLIIMILGFSAFLAVYGSSLPPYRAEPREQRSLTNKKITYSDGRSRRVLPSRRTGSRQCTVTTVPLHRRIKAREDGCPVY